MRKRHLSQVSGGELCRDTASLLASSWGLRGPSSTVPVILPSASGTPQERVLGREYTSELFRQNLSLLKGNPRALLVRMQIGAATVENCMEVPRKIQ